MTKIRHRTLLFSCLGFSLGFATGHLFRSTPPDERWALPTPKKSPAVLTVSVSLGSNQSHLALFAAPIPDEWRATLWHPMIPPRKVDTSDLAESDAVTIKRFNP